MSSTCFGHQCLCNVDSLFFWGMMFLYGNGSVWETTCCDECKQLIGFFNCKSPPISFIPYERSFRKILKSWTDVTDMIPPRWCTLMIDFGIQHCQQDISLKIRVMTQLNTHPRMRISWFIIGQDNLKFRQRFWIDGMILGKCCT